jgi:putative sigma-54 modulation protein
MKINISYHHLESTPSIDQKVREKANHLNKYFDGSVDVNWVCSVERDRHKSEVNVHAGKFHFHAEAEDDNLYKTLDDVLQKIERQVSKQNDKVKDKIHRQGPDVDSLLVEKDEDDDLADY